VNVKGEKKGAIRVVVVEDSRAMAKSMADALDRDPRVEVVGLAFDGHEGYRMVVELAPDVVTLDVQMPGMDGLSAMQHIMVEQPTPCIVVSALTGTGTTRSLEAFELGAIDVIEKPKAAEPRSVELFHRRLLAKIIRASFATRANLGRIRSRPQPTPPPDAQVPSAAPDRGEPETVVVIGASTGGPRTVIKIVSALPHDLNALVIVIQHMPGTFTPSFAERLDVLSALPVCHPRNMARLNSGTVYVAPGDTNLQFIRSSTDNSLRARLKKDAEGTYALPSVDAAMRSALELFGARTMGVLLTGIGSDGANAMAEIKGAGGYTVAESHLSAVIYGMPRAAVEQDAASVVLTSGNIASEIVNWVAMVNGSKC